MSRLAPRLRSQWSTLRPAARPDGLAAVSPPSVGYPALPAKFHKQVQDHAVDSKRRRCGRKGLPEIRPEVAELICDALVDDDNQC